MTDIILHHFPSSHYAEKIRLALGLKDLAWRSVILPTVMPKPDLIPLTGGFRRTPVMQIGADIYCDSERIAMELERRHPVPTLFPPGTQGLAQILGAWETASLFPAVVRHAFALRAEPFPAEFLKDRAALFGMMSDPEGLRREAPRHTERLVAQLEWLEALLEDGRDFLLGGFPGLADLTVQHLVWYVRQAGGEAAAVLSPFPRVTAWAERVDRLGHGRAEPMQAKEALQVARESRPDPAGEVVANALELKAGDHVSVVAEDINRDAVTGELVQLAPNSVALKREDGQVGEVVVHFPRVGYDIQRA
jgi:glutathione S-transferase